MTEWTEEGQRRFEAMAKPLSWRLALLLWAVGASGALAGGQVALDAGDRAPWAGTLMSDDRIEAMTAKLGELRAIRKAVAAQDAELTALRELVEVEKASAKDWLEVATKADRAARAAKSGRFIHGLKCFGLGLLLGIPF